MWVVVDCAGGDDCWLIGWCRGSLIRRARNPIPTALTYGWRGWGGGKPGTTFINQFILGMSLFLSLPRVFLFSTGGGDGVEGDMVPF